MLVSGYIPILMPFSLHLELMNVFVRFLVFIGIQLTNRRTDSPTVRQTTISIIYVLFDNSNSENSKIKSYSKKKQKRETKPNHYLGMKITTKPAKADYQLHKSFIDSEPCCDKMA